MTLFSTFIGIDQTGATNSKGQGKPLPVALVFKQSSKWNLSFSQQGKRLEISNLIRPEILQLLQRHSLPARDLPRAALVVDSVFGLPESQWPFPEGGSDHLFQLFQQAHQFSFQGKALGRDTAESFFKQFLVSFQGEHWPRRKCEIESGANSVFRTRPFQRNIGCGTFRIWKDLGSAPEKWFQIWGFEETAPKLQKGPWIFEAYPSLFWKKILGAKSRNPADLVHWLQTQSPFAVTLSRSDWKLLKEDPDLCDSVVLALGAWTLQGRNEIWQMPKDLQRSKEGWILGL